MTDKNSWRTIVQKNADLEAKRQREQSEQRRRLDVEMKLKALGRKYTCHECGGKPKRFLMTNDGGEGGAPEFDWTKPGDMFNCEQCGKCTCTSDECCWNRLCKSCAIKLYG